MPTPNHTIESVFSEALALRTRKNTDYGDSYDKMFREFGVVYPLPRIIEKANRVKQIAEAGALCEGTIEREFMDIAVIALNAIRVMREDEYPDIHKAVR